MNIRVAYVTDINKILILGEQVFKLHSDARPDLIDKNKKPNNYDSIKNHIENNNGKIFIAEDGENIIGYCITDM